MDLETLIARASKDSEEMRSIDLSLNSLELEIYARDYELIPTLTTNALQTEDRRATFQPGRRALSRLVDVSLSKLYSTGTNINLSSSYELATVANVGDRHIALWQVTLTQSLWRNAFGRSTRLRREADNAERNRRQLELLSRKQLFLTGLENSYWDLAFAAKELEIREENLERSHKLQTWIRQRLHNSAAEKTDEYQVAALVSTRQSELQDAKNRMDRLINLVRQNFPGLAFEGWKPNTRELANTRELNSLLAVPLTSEKEKTAQEPRRIDAIIGKFRSEQTRALAEREVDNVRPRFDAVVTHGRNGIENNFTDAWSHAFGTSQYTQFGVQFVMELDSDLRDARRRALSLQAEAHELDARRLERESKIGWGDLLDRMNYYRDRVKTARELEVAQQRKSEEERKRFNQGRSTAFQTITFEVDAAQAKLDVYRLLSEFRKTETVSRQFTRFQGAVEESR